MMGTATPSDALIDTLPSISLEAIRNDVDLQTRVDRKYVVTADELAQSLAALGSGLRVLEIDGSRAFRYESVYFDTPDLHCYLAAARDRDARFKVRSRLYVDSGRCVLEVKVRGRRGETVKHQMDYSDEDRHGLTAAARCFVSEFVDVPLAGRDLEPVLTTQYERTTLTDGVTRITADARLRCIRTDGAALELPDHVIVETKSTGAVTPTDRLLWAGGARPVSISKYAVGIAGLDPTLPANKWNQTLRRYFGWTPVRLGTRPTGPAGANRERTMS